MAYNPPDLVMGPSCEQYAKCCAVWQRVWWDGLAQHILHPGWPTAGDRVRQQLEPVDIEGVCSGCQVETLAWMDEHSLFTQDTHLVNACALQLRELCGCKSSDTIPPL